EKIVEIIESGQNLPLIQNDKRKLIIKKENVKKQKINTISLDTKDSIIDLNIQDEISFHIVGKYTLKFN
ncbi:3711_t:CDS:1, partial [Dentiscutata erythropus]